MRLRRRDERGYAAILVAALSATIFIPLCALSVDIAREYVEVERVQNAADAAATAGVTFLPDNFAAATAAAVSVAGRNGYTNGSDGGFTTVTTAVGDKPTQLVVTVSTRIPNAFGSAFNANWATVSRSATADYNGPAPMGSPCNAFGNEPNGAVSDSTDPIRGPNSSVIQTPPGGASCTSNPQFWGAVAGPSTPKANGDQYMTRTCASGNDGCVGTTNTDFDPLGYFYIVRVGSAAVGTPITLQVYDPAWVETGNNCEKGATTSTQPNAIAPRDPMNSYTPNDGIQRYSQTTNEFCTGDVRDGGTAPITTSYDVREPTDTYRPSQGAALPACEHQYPGYLQTTETATTPAAVSTGTLLQTKADGSPNPNYNAELAKVFHQWVALCTFTPTRAGDYYLQVRTNVALGGVSDGEGGYTNNSNVYTQSGDDTSVTGDGNNRFALRIKGSQAGAVSVAGWDHMSIYANYTGANTLFNLVRVIPAAASKTLKIQFFDVGDASAPGTITVLPPLDSNLGSTLSGCRGVGVANGGLPNCTLTNVSTNNGWNGKQQVIMVPIPNTYTCNATQTGGCWFRLQVSFPSGLQDTTTWSASIDGDPVRLIK